MSKVIDFDGSAFDAQAVTPNDSVDINIAKALYIGTAGNVSTVTANGTTVTFSNVPNGGYVLCQVSRVRATDTTATNIVALY